MVLSATEHTQLRMGLVAVAKALGIRMPAAAAGGPGQVATDLTPGDGHSVPFDTPAVEHGDKKCPLCPRSFESTSRLKIHMTGHMKSGFDCEDCGKHYNTVVALRRHQENCGAVPQFGCNTCNKQFQHKTSLDEHMKVHTRPVGVWASPHCGGKYATEKIQRDHTKECPKNPEYEGPFMCLVEGCRWATREGFWHIQYHTAHMKKVHGYH